MIYVEKDDDFGGTLVVYGTPICDLTVAERKKLLPAWEAHTAAARLAGKIEGMEEAAKVAGEIEDRWANELASYWEGYKRGDTPNPSAAIRAKIAELKEVK